MVRTAQDNRRTQSLVRSCFIRILRFCSTTQRVICVSVGHTCGHMDGHGVQYSLVPSGVTPDAYVFVRVHLPRCPIVFKPLFNQTFHSLFPCDLFFAGKHTGETGWATGDNQTTVVTTKLRQTVDEMHVQQRITRLVDRQTGYQSPIT